MLRRAGASECCAMFEVWTPESSSTYPAFKSVYFPDNCGVSAATRQTLLDVAGDTFQVVQLLDISCWPELALANTHRAPSRLSGPLLALCRQGSRVYSCFYNTAGCISCITSCTYLDLNLTAVLYTYLWSNDHYISNLTLYIITREIVPRLGVKMPRVLFCAENLRNLGRISIS